MRVATMEMTTDPITVTLEATVREDTGTIATATTKQVTTRGRLGTETGVANAATRTAPTIPMTQARRARRFRQTLATTKMTMGGDLLQLDQWLA
jgi:hypothetical protein